MREFSSKDFEDYAEGERKAFNVMKENVFKEIKELRGLLSKNFFAFSCLEVEAKLNRIQGIVRDMYAKKSLENEYFFLATMTQDDSVEQFQRENEIGNEDY